MQITISPEAAALYREIFEKFGGIGIEIALRESGCNGWRFEAAIVRPGEASDRLISVSNGITFFVRKEDKQRIDGLLIALEQNGLTRKIAFCHPNIVATCGCGESVTFKDDKKN